MKWAGAVLLAGLVATSSGGCAWFHGNGNGNEQEPRSERSALSSRGDSNLFEATGEVAPDEARSAMAPDRRDPFSRSLTPRYRAAAGAAAGEAGALVTDEPGLAEVLAYESGAAAGDETAEAVPGDLPPVGAGPDETDARSRRALWIAMVLVVGIGLSAMWLSRRQA